MLKELLKNKEFVKRIKEFLQNPEIIDIVLFGSAAKGKEKPRDIDLLLLLSPHTKNKHEIEYEVRKTLKKIIERITITAKTYEELFNPAFFAREALLAEGISLRQQKPFSSGLGYAPLFLFKYSLEKMNKSERMRFYYSLQGRGDEQGVLQKTKCLKFSDTIIFSPPESAEVIKDFLKKWGREYQEFPILIPERTYTYIFSTKK